LRQQRRAVDRHIVGFFDSAGRPQNVVGGDAALLARELIAAARPADAFEDAMPHQGLKDRLKMARRQAMTMCKRFGSDRPSPRVQRNVDDSRDSQDAFARQ